MPIRIADKEHNEIDWICDDQWDLPSQLFKLKNWLQTKSKDLQKGSYTANIGFDIRKDASGGGGVLDTETINLLSQINMEIYFSEYPEKEN